MPTIEVFAAFPANGRLLCGSGNVPSGVDSFAAAQQYHTSNFNSRFRLNVLSDLLRLMGLMYIEYICTLLGRCLGLYSGPSVKASSCARSSHGWPLGNVVTGCASFTAV